MASPFKPIVIVSSIGVWGRGGDGKDNERAKKQWWGKAWFLGRRLLPAGRRGGLGRAAQ